MKFSSIVKGISQKCDSALSVVVQKAEDLDVSLERKKRMRELKEEYEDVASILVASLVTLDEETLRTFPHFVQEEISKLNSIQSDFDNQYEDVLEEKGSKVCKNSNCKTEIPAMYNFCPKCGTKQL